MWWQYFLVFIGSMLVDILPFPLPPAFTVMIFLQIKFNLNIWAVILIGVAGSIIGRYTLTMYVHFLSDKIFNAAKNEDAKYLGKRLKEKGWKTQAFVLAYSLMPLPSTPLFLAAGMARISASYIIAPFIVGKFLSDMVLVIMGKYAAENTTDILEGIVSWKSITGLVLGLLIIIAWLYIDWRTLLLEKKFRLKFNIWKR